MIKIDNDCNVNIVTDINGLSKVKYKILYNIIEIILSKFIPMFEWVLGDVSLKNRYLQVVIGCQNYQLHPTSIYKGSLHREGYIEETIEGAGIYYFDKSKWLTKDIFSFNIQTDGVCGGNIDSIEEDIPIKQDTLLVFNNNNLNHKLKYLENTDKHRHATRKIFTFFLPKLCYKPNDIMIKEYNLNNKHIILNTELDNYTYFAVKYLCNKSNIKIILNSIIAIIGNHLLLTPIMMKKIQKRDQLRLKRVKPHNISQTLGWIGLEN